MLVYKEMRDRYNICSGPEITRKTLLISCLYRSYTSSKTFRVGLQTVICFEGIQSFYFLADTNPPFITLQIHNHFLPVFSRVSLAHVLFPDMFFFDQKGYCGCADFVVKEKVI